MKVVLDANIVLALAIPLPYSAQAAQKMTGWQNDETQLFVPTLWVYEVISAIRKSVMAKVISPENGKKALDHIFALDIQQIPPTTTLFQEIFNWADRLNHKQAYDAAYMALAEQLGADFWTADKRLANRAKQLNLTWVYQISSP